jgi:hypothetical protein
VRVETADGTTPATAGTRFFFAGAPVVTALSPDRCPDVAAYCSQVEVTGEGFVPGAHALGTPPPATRVSFGGVPAPYVWCESVQRCSVSVPFGPAHGELVNRVVDLRVETPTGSAARPFTYGPVATELTPKAGPATGGTVATLTGIGLDGVTAVAVGSVPARFRVVSPTELAVTMPAVPAGTRHPLTLTTALGRWVTDPGDPALGQGVTWDALAPPVIEALEPPYGYEGSAVRLVGRGFAYDGEPRVWFGAAESPGTGCSAAEATCWAFVPPGTGTVPVTIETSAGRSAPTPAAVFTYFPPPEVTGMSPTSGPLAGGTRVTVTGRDLSVLRVSIGSRDAVLVESSADAFTFVTPEGNFPGTWSVDIETRGGPLVLEFTYV